MKQRFTLSILVWTLLATPAHAFLKGLGSNNYVITDPAKIYHVNAKWAYHWGPAKPAGMGSLEFVPMLWDTSYVTAATISALTAGRIAGDFTQLLGFNEPDLASQANMTPQQAIALWPQLLATGLRLGAPATSSPYAMSQTSPGIYWIDHFMQLANAAGYRVDFIPIHVYQDFTNAAAPSWVAGWVNDIRTRFNKPVWVTEIGSWNGSYSQAPTVQLSVTYMENVLKMLDTLAYVERVAWFTDQCWANALCQYTSLYDAIPNLTAMGQFYKNYPMQAVPGRVQAEDYTGFNDSTPGNAGTMYRWDNVDMEACTDLLGGWDIGWSVAGEWLDYRINVASAGLYDLSFRVAVPAGTQSIQLRLDGAVFGGAISLPATGGNQIWNTVVLRSMTLPAGQHTLRVEATTGLFNFNYIDIAPHHNAPGKIEAENFSAFSDTGVDNNGAPLGAEYRFQDVDLNVCTDTGGGYNCGWTAAGEWTEYPIQVTASGPYNFNFRVASGLAGNGSMQMMLDGAAFGPVLTVPSTGGWQNWTTVSINNQILSAGPHTLRLQHSAGGVNFNYLDIVFLATPTPTPTATPYAGSPTPTPTFTVVSCSMPFEDFESGVLLNPLTYSDGVSGLGYALTTTAYAGSRSLLMTVYTVGGTWGAGMNFGSQQYTPQGIVNAAGRTRLKLYVKTDKAVTFSVRAREGNSSENGGEEENWVSPNQSLAASALWQTLSLDTALFTEDMNNGICSPNCATFGDNALDLQSVKKLEFQFALGINNATVLVDTPQFELPSLCGTPTRSMTPTPYAGTPTRTPSLTPVSCSVPFENFETTLVAPLNFADAVSGVGFGLSTTAAVSGTQSLAMTVFTVGGTWGGGVNFGSSYGVIDATGRTRLRLWIKTNLAINFSVRFKEGSPAENGGDSENWISPNQVLAASAAWQALDLDTTLFTEDLNNGSCSPNCGTSGNNAMNLQSVKRLEILFGPGINDAVVYLDDPRFELAGACGTPTNTPSPSFSPTRSPVASPTSTPTPSPTLSPTLTRTPTPSASPSPTVTRTFSPTLSVTPSHTPTLGGSPTFTRTLTASPSPSQSATRTVSPLASMSPSGTPSLSQTLTRTATQSATRTVSVSPSASPSVSPSNTVSPVQSATSTPTQSPVWTATLSPSFSRTPTATLSPSASPSQSMTRTLSPSGTTTVSPSRTPTLTGSATVTLSSTPSLSPSQSPSFSPSPLQSATPSLTQSPAWTFTVSPSRTPSPSSSPSSSVSPSRTATPSPSLTATLSPSPSVTQSPSPSLSPSFTESPVTSATRTPTRTPAWTATASPSPSPSLTATLGRTSTLSATPTPSPSRTFSPSSTVSPTFSPTLSPTRTTTVAAPVTSTRTMTFLASLTASPTQTAALTASPRPGKPGRPKPLQVMAVPNPQSGSQLRLALKLESDADSLEILVYTKAMTVVERVELRGPFPAGWCQATLPFSQPPSSGLYYIIVSGINGEGRESQDGITKALFLQ